jgi:uncharacterized membrane protein
MTHHPSHNANARPEPLARGLGWFSIGLGIAELAAPGALARLIGLRPDAATAAALRALGAREIGHGVAILGDPRSAARVWSRVGGDAIDLAYLGTAMQRDGADRARVMAAIAAVAGVTVLDVLCAQQLGRQTMDRGRRLRRGDVRIETVETVNRSIEDVYQFWRDFENFPRFMRHIESVEKLDERRSRWRAKGPAGVTAEWVAEIVDDREPDRISWRSTEGSRIYTAGAVTFRRAPGARGTEVRARIHYRAPGGPIGQSVGWLLSDMVESEVHEDLHRVKQLLETGEIPLSDGPGLWRPAQPAARPQEVRTLAGVER